jgi:NAD(P) transhydrogenase
MRHYDLCVIGSGPAGQRAAIQAAKLGKSVCVVERREVVGGVAINTGTIPSKAMREAILRAGGHKAAMPTVTDFFAARNALFTTLLTSCQDVIKAEVELIRGHFDRNGVEVVTGLGQFRDAHTIDAISEHAMTTLTADFVMIGVGTYPTKPKSMPFDGQTVISSDEILKLPYLPKSMIIVGGGVIGTEYASMMQALGVKVTLIEGRTRLLDFVDGEIVEAFQYHLRNNGATLRMGEKVVTVRHVEPMPGVKTQGGPQVEAVLESGKAIRADCLLYAVGRQGATDGLNLGTAGLQADDRGRIKVNQQYQTEVPHIYAAGDVIGFPALASTSLEQGRQAACHMFKYPFERVEETIPYGIYSIPEISMVGWTEERLTAEGVPYESGIAHYKEIARGQLLGDDIGMLKLLIHQDSHAILGVHIIGTGATELVHIGQGAIAFKATVEHFVNTVFNYPTLAECYKVAAFNALNKLRAV